MTTTRIWALLVLALPTLEPSLASAQTVARRIRVVCVDARTGSDLACKVSRVPPQTSEAPTSELELLDPIIRFRATADAASYDSREVEINAASLFVREPTLQIALAQSLAPNLQPSLQSIGRASRLLDAERTVDRGLALMEQIRPGQLSTGRLETFAVRYLYWNFVGLMRACTRSFYQTCNDAETAVADLLARIKANPREFAAEDVTAANVEPYGLEIRAARVRKTVHRAKWYLALNEFDRSQEEYQAARDSLASGEPGFPARVGYSIDQIDADLRLLSTRKAQLEARNPREQPFP